MDESKRSFLKIAGTSVLGTLGVACNPSIVGTPGQVESLPERLTAKRWGMVVDAKKCLQEKGCSDCIEACHQIHNVPSVDRPGEEVKWIWKEEYEDVFPTQAHPYTQMDLKGQPILVLCNHCESPPCVRVCPTQATWKREDDGLVMMDQHRCIGCRYCIVACPYGSRSFNWSDPRQHLESEPNPEFPTRTRGVVEKCNFCAERVARGLRPACVDACPNGALAFGDLEDSDSEVAQILKKQHSIRRKPNLGTGPQIYYLV
jgi:molybdopterin-containing oxidoreductase family iron-sulfur binding subunit